MDKTSFMKLLEVTKDPEVLARFQNCKNGPEIEELLKEYDIQADALELYGFMSAINGNFMMSENDTEKEYGIGRIPPDFDV